MYKICHLRDATDPKATIKLLMIYNPTAQEDIPAPLEWGHLKEGSARNCLQRKLHQSMETGQPIFGKVKWLVARGKKQWTTQPKIEKN